MFELSHILGLIAAILLLFAALAWLKPSRVRATATAARFVAAKVHRSQAAAMLLLLALGLSALAAIVAVIGMFVA